MNKKFIIFIILILLLIAGKVFWWWESGKELRELNKSLPEGIKVEKREGQQVVVNKKDGYEIKVPDEWKGVRNLNYREIEDGRQRTIYLEANEGQIIEIRTHQLAQTNIELESWVKDLIESLQDSRYSPNTLILGKEKIGNYEILKTKEEGTHIMPTFYFYYFQKDSKIYEIFTDYSEENIRDIILKGKF